MKRFCGPRPSLARVKELYRYDPLTGFFYREMHRGSRYRKGSKAGTTNSQYVHIIVDDGNYYGHVLAWFIMTGEWPCHEIDHKNLDKCDNAWTNLRKASSTQNKQNAPIKNVKKTSKYKGVSWVKDCHKWTVHICVEKKQMYLGLFVSEDEAHEVYCAAAKKHFGEFARVA